MFSRMICDVPKNCFRNWVPRATENIFRKTLLLCCPPEWLFRNNRINYWIYFLFNFVVLCRKTMDMELFTGISDEMDIWCGDDVDM